jgi:hypothetical protein
MESKKHSGSRQQPELSFPLASAGFQYGLLFNPEDGGDMCLRNIRLPSNYTALQLRKLYSSQSPL